ncbi:MAG TPA: hypothetical protein VK250_10340 [Nitrososphaeraceae archaeon]|nr:hypothetical protein [Nitrososphaeraceae archaeon]
MTHPNKNVNIICLPCTTDNKIYDLLFISESYFTDANIIEEKRISEGDDIFICIKE